VAHDYIFVDQFSGSVVHTVYFLKDFPGYRVSRFNRSIHTGDIWGAPGHPIASLFSHLLVCNGCYGIGDFAKEIRLSVRYLTIGGVTPITT